MSYVVVAGCPCPRKLAPVLRMLLRRSGAHLQSCYRGADAEWLLHRLGKHSQRELYEAWRQRRPGANPAAAPGHSTHELRSDAFAYPGPIGRHLEWWQCGIDIDDAHVGAFIETAARHGYRVHRPYAQGSEHHHINFSQRPRRRQRARARLHGLARRVRRMGRA